MIMTSICITRKGAQNFWCSFPPPFHDWIVSRTLHVNTCFGFKGSPSDLINRRANVKTSHFDASLTATINPADFTRSDETTYAQKSSTVSNLEMRRRFSVQLLLLSFLKYHRAHLRGRTRREFKDYSGDCGKITSVQHKTTITRISI